MARGARLNTIVTERRKEAYSPVHGAGYALNPAHLDTSMWSDPLVMDGLHTTLDIMAAAHEKGKDAAEVPPSPLPCTHR